MAAIKCRNSVFCVQFLFFFLLGTICGIWLYHCGSAWMAGYCVLLGQAPVRDGWSLGLAWLRPLVIAWLASIHPLGDRVVPVLIVVRGLLTAYSTCACLRAGLPTEPVLLRGLVLLPLFYWLCRRASGCGERDR